MVPFGIGQKRKATVAFDSVRQAATKAAALTASGDYHTAIAHYDQVIESLRPNLNRRALSEGAAWSDPFCGALLDKARALAAMERRPSVEKMEAMLGDLFALKPDWPDAHEFMMEFAVSRQEPQTARRYINRLLAINPAHQRALFLLAVIDFENQQYGDALRQFAALPESQNTLCYIARCYLRSGQTDNAIEVLEKAVRRFEETYEGHYYLGCALAQAGRYDDARQVFSRLSRWTPRRAEGMVQLGNLYLMTGWVAEAERCFKEAIKLGPHDPVPAHYGLALAAAQCNSERFITYFGHLRQISPDSEFYYCALADGHERAGCLDEALAAYGAVPAQGRLAGAAAARLGMIHYRRGDYRQALAALSEAAQRRPNDYRVLEMLGAAAALTGDYRQAVATWSKLPNRRRSDDRLSCALRSARFRIIADEMAQGRLEEAHKQLESFDHEAQDPAFARALAELHFADGVAALRAMPPAIERARAMLELGKGFTPHPKFDYALAIADLLAGDYLPAAMRLQSVLAANAKNPGASYHLGLALLCSGDTRGAEHALRHGISVSFNRPSKLGRLQYALAALLARERRWAEAAAALEEFTPGEEADAQPTAAQAMELRLRCLVMSENWTIAEEAVRRAPKDQRTALAAIILAAQNLKADRLSDAALCIEHYLRMTTADAEASAPLTDKVKQTLAPLALKAAAQEARRSRFHQALTPLRRALSLLAETEGVMEDREALNEFADALDKGDGPRINQSVRRYSALDVGFVLEARELEPSAIEVPVVLPPASQRSSEVIGMPPLKLEDWDAAPYPDPLIIFDN
jgi:tetratricopeptide (TPR) repeat protein